MAIIKKGQIGRSKKTCQPSEGKTLHLQIAIFPLTCLLRGNVILTSANRHLQKCKQWHENKVWKSSLIERTWLWVWLYTYAAKTHCHVKRLSKYILLLMARAVLPVFLNHPPYGRCLVWVHWTSKEAIKVLLKTHTHYASADFMVVAGLYHADCNYVKCRKKHF